MKRMSLMVGKREETYTGLSESIAEVVRLLQLCRQRFNLALDEELLEAAIYEENALLARYRYLLRLAREESEPEKITAGGIGKCLTPSTLEDF